MLAVSTRIQAFLDRARYFIISQFYIFQKVSIMASDVAGTQAESAHVVLTLGGITAWVIFTQTDYV